MAEFQDIVSRWVAFVGKAEPTGSPARTTAVEGLRRRLLATLEVGWGLFALASCVALCCHATEECRCRHYCGLQLMQAAALETGQRSGGGLPESSGGASLPSQLVFKPTFLGERHDADVASIKGIRAGALGDVGALVEP